LVGNVTQAGGRTTTTLSLRNDAVSWTPTDDGQAVVLDTRASRYLALNAAGSLLWGRLASGTTESDLIEALSAEYDLDVESAARDVKVFLAEVRARDLLIAS